MMQKIIFVPAFLFLFSCQQATEKTVEPKIVSTAISSQPTVGVKKNGLDSLIFDYINQCHNELIMASRKDTVPEQWLIDNADPEDTASCFMVHIGHDVSDPGNTNPRFATDGWIYIQKTTKKIFEYDVAKDTLTAWKR